VLAHMSALIAAFSIGTHVNTHCSIIVKTHCSIQQRFAVAGSRCFGDDAHAGVCNRDVLAHSNLTALNTPGTLNSEQRPNLSTDLIEIQI
jgi:hypothetical protein